jgi:hypothetical protein
VENPKYYSTDRERERRRPRTMDDLLHLSAFNKNLNRDGNT